MGGCVSIQGSSKVVLGVSVRLNVKAPELPTGLSEPGKLEAECPLLWRRAWLVGACAERSRPILGLDVGDGITGVACQHDMAKKGLHNHQANMTTSDFNTSQPSKSAEHRIVLVTKWAAKRPAGTIWGRWRPTKNLFSRPTACLGKDAGCLGAGWCSRKSRNGSALRRPSTSLQVS